MFSLSASGFATGEPLSFAVDPATVRQRDRDITPIEAAVALKTPAPSFFVCEIRSYDRRKINFPTIIFKKGEIKGKSDGTVYWKSIPKDCRVRLCAFSVDAPDQQLSFTVTLKPKAPEPTPDTETP